MRIMSLDVGEKNIGVAVSDELGITAQGLGVIKRQNKKKDLSEIRRLIEEHNVNEVVLGFPRNMDGSIGSKAQEILHFQELLSKSVSVPVLTWDERLTTVAANRTLLQADVSRKKRKKVIDKLAAVLILEGYLQKKKRE
ncbi:MAG: Holliday junction resolvase RuvX [Bacillota bacterium]|nr:Holliday junction resolvase RuvX [Bacillota bacterium]